MYTYETKTLHEIGRVKVVVKRVLDENADYGYLGKYTDSDCVSKGQWLYHRNKKLVSNDGYIWRNTKGQISCRQTAEDKEHEDFYNGCNGEYKYILLDNGQDKIKYVIQDAKRLDSLGTDWDYYGVIAELYFEGVKIASNSLWGIESDSEESYFLQTEREVAQQAISLGKAWIRSIRNK